MPIRLEHAPSPWAVGMSGYAAGTGARRQRQQKYALDLFQQDRQNRYMEGRQDQRQATLAAREADAMEARAAALSAERGAAAAAARRSEAERRLARLATDLRADEARIAALRDERRAEAARLSAEARSIEAERAEAARRGADQGALAGLEARQQALRRAVDAAFR